MHKPCIFEIYQSHCFVCTNSHAAPTPSAVKINTH